MNIKEQFDIAAKGAAEELSLRDGSDSNLLMATITKHMQPLLTRMEEVEREVAMLSKARAMVLYVSDKIATERDSLLQRVASLEKDKERLDWFVKWIWESRWVSEESLYQDIVGRAAEIRSGNYDGIDSAIANEKGNK